MKNIIFILCCCFVSINSQANKTSSNPQLEQLTSQIEQIRKDQGVSATVVILIDRQRTLIKAHLGTRSWQSNSAMNNQQMFRIGSISKSFAALLALRLQQQGLIDLNQSFDHYLKSTYIENNYANKITLAQLLEHTAGLAELSKAEWDYNDPKPITLKQAFALKLAPHQSNWPPAMHSSYSNVGAGLLGLALEQATGQSYETLMQTHVFAPLAMKSSTLLLTEKVKTRLITGYNTDGTTVIPYWHNIYRPFAAINTDADDIIQFLRMLNNQGQSINGEFLPASAIKRMQDPQTTLAAKSGLHYGYGLANYHWQVKGHTFHGHGGDADGYLSRYGYNRESGLAYFVMINAFKHKPLKQMRNLLEAYTIKDLPKPHYPPVQTISKQQIQQYQGNYQAVTTRFGSLPQKPTLKIFTKDQQLYIQKLNSKAQPIYAVNQQHFRYADEAVATMAFIPYQGTMYFQGDIGNFVKLTIQQ
ncbi:MAG TPA: class A beta-lactamase-related serine hydrolase [Oceanospirillales bacterium]|nr:class A beta-lactamase-related serine hydrolase [Oceanospirillales bacterium]